MELRDFSAEELEARKLEIRGLLDAEDADLDALETEARAINTELENRAAAEAEKVEERKKVAEDETLPEVEKSPVEERTMENKEIRNSDAYIEAYAHYVKTNDAAECRALLTENADGSVLVPDVVIDTVKTAWEREEIMSLVTKTFVKGNLRMGFEISGTDAVIHEEGEEVTEEELVMGTVQIVPQAIKKWISISDEALDMAAVPYLKYIYSELTYRIAKKAAEELLGLIVAAPAASTTTAVGVPSIQASTIGLGTIAEAIAHLSDEATNPVIVMNKLTYAKFKAAQYAANFAADPFEGLHVVFNNSIKDFDNAGNDPYLIVGDFREGALANFPAGQEISIKRDDFTLATKDLVRIIGREYVGLGIVAPNAFVKVTK